MKNNLLVSKRNTQGAGRHAIALGKMPGSLHILPSLDVASLEAPIDIALSLSTIFNGCGCDIIIPVACCLDRGVPCYSVLARLNHEAFSVL